MVKLNLNMIDEYYEMVKDTRNECEGFIYDFLEEHGNYTPFLTDDGDVIGNECVFINVNGKKAWVMCLLIDKDDNDIYTDLDLDGCPTRCIDKCSTDELISIAQYLSRYDKEFDKITK